MRAEIRVSILGPVEIVGPDGPIHIGGPRTRALLVALVLAANHAVLHEQLIGAVWGDEAPATAENTLQSHISKLRRLLGPGAITAKDHTYRLDADCGQIDSCRFERLVLEAVTRLETEPEEARRMSRQAIGLWRGSPLGDLAEAEFARVEVVRLDELRLTAIETELEADLRLGRLEEALPRLRAVTSEYPYRERLWHLLIGALSRSGRRIEARQTYDSFAEMLAESGLLPEHPLEELVELARP